MFYARGDLTQEIRCLQNHWERAEGVGYSQGLQEWPPGDWSRLLESLRLPLGPAGIKIPPLLLPLSLSAGRSCQSPPRGWDAGEGVRQQLMDRQMVDAQKTLISTLAAKTSQRRRKMAFPSHLPARSPERTSKRQDPISMWSSKGLEVRLFVFQLFQWEGTGTKVGRDIQAGSQMRRTS